jgi:hypothetical protein
MAGGAIIAANNIARRKKEDAEAITRAMETWQLLAREHGLSFAIDAKDRPTITGTLNGMASLATSSSSPLTAFLYERGRVLVQFPTVETNSERIHHALEAVTEAARWAPPSDQAFR